MNLNDRTITLGGKIRRVALPLLLVAGLAAGSFPFSYSAHASKPAAHSSVTALINIGEKNFDEEFIIGDMYSLLLQKAGFRTKVHVLGSEPGPFQTAMLHGQLDLYPEYTGTGLIGVLGLPGIANQAQAYKKVKRLYQKKFHFTWLKPAPMNDTNAIVVTQATAGKYHLKNLSSLATVASKLSFVALPPCKGRADCQAGLQSVYGINFKSVTYATSVALDVQALVSGQADVAEVFGTTPLIQKDHLVVLPDNKAKVFPADNIAPVVRDPILHKYPRIATILDKLAKYLTTKAVINLNAQFDIQNLDHMTIARKFLKSKHLI